ncbi:XRE family transcriptional regulator [Luteimonas sp. TWI1437]|uniref:helix-turn-helix domain-containing protein n=1 Tax=unclassified Luteimonas TaxID=2629088 RepID=UPI0032096520
MAFVANNVRERRLAAGLSQKALAARSGVSQRMIGAIEAGTSSVSTATLDRIGIALDATLAELVTDPSAPRSVMVDRLGWTGAHGGSGILRWSVNAVREVDAWAWQLQPGDRYQAAADPAGWHVMLFVLQGRLTLELDDVEMEIEADAHVFESATTHAYSNRTDSPVRFYRCTVW